MKKIIIIIIASFLFVGCTQATVEVDTKTKLKENEISDMSEYENLDNSNIRFQKEDAKSIVKKLKAKETGIYYIGFPGCLWCQELVSVLNEVLIENNKVSYYLDLRSDEFQKNKQLVDDYTEFDKSLEESSNTSVPFVIVIDNEKNIKTHLGTVDGHDAYEDKMTSDQEKELFEILDTMID